MKRSAAYRVTVTNTGSKSTDGSPITIAITIPPGLTATAVTGLQTGHPPSYVLEPYPQLSATCVLATLTCVYPYALEPGDSVYVDLYVLVAPGTKSPVTASAEVSGGGAQADFTSASNVVGTAAESAATPYGFESFSTEVRGADGLTDLQAGDHPYEENTSFSLNTIAGGSTAGGVGGDRSFSKDFVVDLPPGFIGNPDVVAKCPQRQIGILQGTSLAAACPPASQIGEALISRNTTQEGGFLNHPAEISEFPIYNVVPDHNFPAEFMFSVLGVPVVLYATVNPSTDYGVRVIVPDVPSEAVVNSVSVTFFGSPVQDPNTYNHVAGLAGVQPSAFLTDPTACSAGPLTASISSDSWEHPGAWLADGSPPYGSPDLSDPNWKTARAVVFPSLEGCEMLQFNPSLMVEPTTTQADEPSGLRVDLLVPQAEQLSPHLATPELKNVTVTFPSGFSLSPSAADGLQACSGTQIDLGSVAPGACPEASILGTAKVTTPLLPEPLTGHLFLGTPGCGQPGEGPCSTRTPRTGTCSTCISKWKAQVSS